MQVPDAFFALSRAGTQPEEKNYVNSALIIRKQNIRVPTGLHVTTTRSAQGGLFPLLQYISLCVFIVRIRL